MRLTYDAGVLLALMLYACMALLCGFSVYHRCATLQDYTLGKKSLGKLTSVLSVFSSDMSAWIMLALPGLAYRFGLTVLWIGVGLVLGIILMRRTIAPRLRAYMQLQDFVSTLPQFFGKRFQSRSLRLVSAFLLLLFSFTYVASCMNAGGKLAESIFGLKYSIGVIIIALLLLLIFVLSCFLSSARTDLLQACLILFTLLVTPFTFLFAMEEARTFPSLLGAISPSLLNPFSQGFAGWLSFLSLGLGYLGIPHILSRYMAAASVRHVRKASVFPPVLVFLAVLGACLCGWIGRVLLPDALKSDMQSEFVILSLISDSGLFSSFIAGLLLSGILAAILSTCNSLLIQITGVLAGDLLPVFTRSHREKKQLRLSRILTFVYALPALWLALNPEITIHSLVLFAWCGLGASFGPALLLSLFVPQTNGKATMCGMLCGALIVILWQCIPLLNQFMNAMLPAFLLNLCVNLFLTSFGRKQSPLIIEEFKKARRLARGKNLRKA